MTDNPACLLEARTLLLDHLGPYGLAPLEVGIKGDAAHIGEGDSYHLGTPEQDPNGNYSVGESARDRNGLSRYASALDIGTFSYGAHNLRTFSVWLVAQCKAGTADTRHIREVIYSPDGVTVKRWDRLGRRSTGDKSHLGHTHVSFFRDATKAGYNLAAVFRRYLTEIGLIDDMTDADRAKLNAIYQAIFYGGSSCGADVPTTYRVAGTKSEGNAVVDKLNMIGAAVTAAKPAPVAVDASAVAAALAGNAAFVAALAKAVNDDAARRLAS